MNDNFREILLSHEFEDYYRSLNLRVKTKYNYVIQIMRSQYVVSEKFVKHLENTDLYEIRVSVSSNEYRTILFAIDAENFMESKQILLLNSFLKKSNSQYKTEIEKAISILNKLKEEI